jgi:hypothetical protein
VFPERYELILYVLFRYTRSRFSMTFLDPTANSELARKFHFAPHASHADLPMLTSKFRPYIAIPMLDQISL